MTTPNSTAYVKLTLFPESGYDPRVLHGGMCKGAYLLLDGIDRTGSLFAAAKELGMAYSKAWTLVERVQDAFGTDLVESLGPHGSKLTDDGRALVKAYREQAEAVGASLVQTCPQLRRRS